MTSGFRTFTAGEVLTASNVQNYLMDQSVMTFAGSAARSSAIGTANFEEGMASYLKDTDKLEVYNGTDWVGVAPTTTQGLTLINTTSFSGVASQSINDVFSATYDNYKIVLYCRTSETSETVLRFRLRSGGTDNTNNWNSLADWTSNSVLGSGSNDSGQAYGVFCFGGNLVTASEALVAAPFLAFNTGIIVKSMEQSNSDQYTSTHGLYHSQTTSYTGFTLYPAAGTFTGKIQVFGVNQ